jgi:beta-lactamase regulating signal transducer with metallopeptidase domain
MVASTATASAWVDALTRHGAMLLGGATALLVAGYVAMRLLGRAPVHRQRLGELTIGVTCLWLALAAIPLPRWLAGPVYPSPAKAEGPRIALSRDTRDAAPVPLSRGTSPLTSNDGAHAQAAGADDLARLTGAVALLEHSDLDWHGEPRPAALPAAARPNPWWTPARLTAAAYLTGALACAAWLAIGYRLLARLLRAARPAESSMQAEFDRLCRELLPVTWRGRRPSLLISESCGRPMACGVLRPVVLLPAGAVGARRPADIEPLRQVLRHELAHVRRRDAAGHALLNLALPLLYAHPLYWLVRRDVHLARELIADDWAAAGAPGGRAAYVEQLVAFARRTASSPWGRAGGPRSASIAAGAAVGLIGAFQTQTTFYRRMHMLLHRPPSASLATRCSPTWRLASWAGCLAALVFSAGLWA